MKKMFIITAMIAILGLVFQSCSNTQAPTSQDIQSPTETISADNTQLFDTELGDEGCTPGYWKNHLDSWPINPAKTVGQTFGEAYAHFPNYADDTLLDALNYGGGSGVDGAARILLRAAAAAALNSQHHGVAYSCPPHEVRDDVNAALASEDRDTMLALKDRLDGYNNGVGGCPLN